VRRDSKGHGTLSAAGTGFQKNTRPQKQKEQQRPVAHGFQPFQESPFSNVRERDPPGFHIPKGNGTRRTPQLSAGLRGYRTPSQSAVHLTLEKLNSERRQGKVE